MLAGRFAHLNAPAGLQYTMGHRNFPGKYLLEMPIYLFPWTLLILAAGVAHVIVGVTWPTDSVTVLVAVV